MSEITRSDLESLRAEIAELREEVRSLRARVGESVDEETLQIIAAAVAVYLGKRATIRYVRKGNEEIDGWKATGRVTIAGQQMMRTMPGLRGITNGKNASPQ